MSGYPPPVTPGQRWQQDMIDRLDQIIVLLSPPPEEPKLVQEPVKRAPRKVIAEYKLK